MRWSLISTFTLLLSFNTLGQHYQAPHLKLSMHPDNSGQTIKEGQWESDYKVEENVYPDRDVASEEELKKEDSKKRSPSSERKPSSKGKKPGIEPWPFDPSEE